MFCAIYKSTKKESTYLYIRHKDQFESIPEQLLKQFGKPIFVTVLDLSKREHLARVSSEIVKKSLEEKGYYLQLPPVENDPLLSYIQSQNNKL